MKVKIIFIVDPLNSEDTHLTCIIYKNVCGISDEILEDCMCMKDYTFSLIFYALNEITF